MSLDVGSGRYAFLCLFEDFNPLTGPNGHRCRARVGHSGDPPGDLQRRASRWPSKYQLTPRPALKVLARETATLAADVRDGNLAAAKRDWLTAHLQYETLGGGVRRVRELRR